MKRRSKAGSEPVKEPRRKALKPKRDAPKAIAHSDLSNAGQEIAVARLTRELNEALEQQKLSRALLFSCFSYPEVPSEDLNGPQ